MTYPANHHLVQQLEIHAQSQGCTIEQLLKRWLVDSRSVTKLEFRALIEDNPDLIARFDHHLRFVYVNPALEQAAGLARERFLGQTNQGMGFPEPERQRFEDVLREVFTSGQHSRVEIALSLKGSLRHLEVLMMPERNHAGQVETVLAVGRDVTERKLLERRLYESEERYRAIVESQIDLVCRYTPDTRLTFVNDAYCRFFRRTREELIGNSYLGLNSPGHTERVLTRIEQVLQDPRPEVALIPVLMADGEERWIQWVDHGIVDESGKVVEIQAVGRDVTDLKRLEAQRVRAAELESELTKQREVLELKNQFMSMVSHEFRTPLSIIKASAEILMRYASQLTPARSQEHLERINEQVDHMTQMLDEVLTLDRSQVSLSEFRPEPVNLAIFCQPLVNYFQSHEGREHRLSFDYPPQMIEPVMVDTRFVNRILGNLLTNAIKYSAPGSQVRLTLRDEGRQVLFSVADEGVGILEDEQPQIFDVFFRGRNVRDIPGTGLGLAIVRQHVLAHGGQIWFDSRPGQGTTFYVRLPAR